MPRRALDPNALGLDEDWKGNDVAFRCPSCAKVFLVSGTRMHIGPSGEKGYRKCPSCGKSVGHAQRDSQVWRHGEH